MKKVSFFLTLIFLTGCFTMDAEDTAMGKFKLKNGDLLEVVNRGVGATAPDVIWIFKTDTLGNKVIVGKLVGLGSYYAAEFKQLNDTLLKMELTDTSVFKGSVRVDTINLNNKIIPNT